MAARNRSKPLDDSSLALLALDNDISTGSQKLRPEDLLSRERPATPQDAFKRSRSWCAENWFVEQINLLKRGFYTYGQAFVPVDPKDHDKLKKFWQEKPDVLRALNRYHREVWQEWLALDTVISFWREKTKTAPFLFKAEICKYADRGGIRILKVKLDKPEFTPTKVQSENETGGLGYEAMIERYFKGKEITMDATTEEQWDEHFEVLTRGLRGEGFVLPRLYAIFRTLSQVESMEVGETMLAYAGRRVIHRHKLGFEARSNTPAANFQKEFSMWTKKRAQAMLSFFSGRSGFMDTVDNWDAELDVFLGDGGPKNWDGRKWDTVIKRLLWWAGPLGFMLLANSMNPFLLPILKSAAEEDRKEVSDHLNFVVNQGFELPCRIKVKYSNRCFLDSRLAWDMVNGLMKQGPLSLTTALHEGDFDPQTEERRKLAEAAPAKSKIYLPLVSPTGKNDNGNNGKAGRPSERGGGEGAKRSGATSGKRK